MIDYIIKLVKQSFFDMRRQKLRCLLTMSGIIWGTMSVILLLAFGQSFRSAAMKSMSGMGSNILILSGNMTTKPHEGMPSGRWIRLRPELIGLMRDSIAEIDLISPEIQNWITLNIGPERQNKNCVGVDPDYGRLRNLFAKKGGRFINPLDIEQRRRVVFLGSAISEKFFGKDTDPVGKTINLKGIPFTVIGVMEHKIQNSSYMNRDADIAFIPFSTCREMFGVTHINRIIYRARSAVETPKLKENTYDLLSRRLGFDPTDKDALGIWDTSEATQFLHYFFIGFELFLFLGGVLTLVVGGIGVANIMYVSIRERKREIGIKTALGATPKHILTQFLLESFIIMAIGGGIGVAGAWGLVTFFGLDIFAGAHPVMGVPKIDMTVAVVTATVLAVIGFSAGWAPAKSAADLDPVQALEF